MEQLKKFDMSLGTGLVELTGNKLPAESIIFSPSMKVPSGPKVEWNMNRAVLLQPKPLKDWTLIVPSKSKRDSGVFLENLMRSSKSMGFPLEPPKV